MPEYDIRPDTGREDAVKASMPPKSDEEGEGEEGEKDDATPKIPKDDDIEAWKRRSSDEENDPGIIPLVELVLLKLFTF